jgi:8-oxo-dGTP pyrophosphatase MutT (NUDIX family)
MSAGSGFLRHLAACNPPIREPLLPFHIDGRTVGWVRPPLARDIATAIDAMTLIDGGLQLAVGCDFAAASEVLAEVAEWLAHSGLVASLLQEPYAVTPAGRDQALAVIDRAAAPFLGIRTFGQHVNGYLRRSDGIWMWLGRRARDRAYYPGCLDNIAAGGVPHGLSLAENLRKECHEEAGIASELADQARPVGLVSYNRLTSRGFRSDILYCYDLELPETFRPLNTDGEVETFDLLPLTEVVRLVRETSQFKLNCNLVIVDFLLRHGYIAADDPHYLELVLGLRRTPGLSRS